MQALGVLDVDGLDVGVEALLGVLLVVTLAGDADTETEGDTLDTGFPDLLVELGVDADVLGTLLGALANRRVQPWGSTKLTIACSAKARISLMALGARFLKLTPWHYIPQKKLQSVFRPNAICKRKLCAMNVCGLSAIVDFIKLILLLCSGFGCVDVKKAFSSPSS